MDFEPLARKALPPAHWGYMATGVDDNKTLRINREAFDHYQLRARRLVDVTHADLKTEVFGAMWDTPIYVSAVGSQKAFHPEGEIATARAAKAKKTMQMLSTVTSVPVEEVAKALGTAPWYQLYMPTTWGDTEKMVKRAEAAGCPVLGVDYRSAGRAQHGNRDAFRPGRPAGLLTCHTTSPTAGANTQRNQGKPMFAGLSGEMNPPGATWSYVERLKKMTRMKLVLKGIDTAEDAKLARDYGADGVVVSNHGGRAAETGRGTIDILPEVVDAVGPAVPRFRGWRLPPRLRRI